MTDKNKSILPFSGPPPSRKAMAALFAQTESPKPPPANFNRNPANPNLPPNPDGTTPAPVPGQFVPRAAMPTTHPRKVRGGLKLQTRSGPVSTAWAAQRWMRLVENLASPGAMNDGLHYARLGQTRSLDVRPGHIHAVIQGRMPSAYSVDIRMPVLTAPQWQQVTDAMITEARHLASLLAGQVPSNVEELFSPLQLKLFPQDAMDLSVSCTCAGATSVQAQAQPVHAPTEQAQSSVSALWCKHVACAMALTAERLAGDTFLIFLVRGISRDDLLEQLRFKRATSGKNQAVDVDGNTPASLRITDARPVPAYLPRLPGISDVQSPQLHESIDQFWSVPAAASPTFDAVNNADNQALASSSEPSAVAGIPDLSMHLPAVSHPLLRRLGPSPFDPASGATFPLVGLLATCYDVISQHELDSANTALAITPNLANTKQ